MAVLDVQPLRYQTAREAIAEWIATGQVGPEGRLPSERELAERFDMNRRTVRRALADLVAEGVLYKQPRAGCFVRPIRASAKRRVRAERQGLIISVPLSRTFEQFMQEPAGIARDHLRGIAEAGRENGAVVEFQFVPPSRHVAYMLDLVEQDPPHGVILYGAGGSKLRRVTERVIERRIPYVAVQPERLLSWDHIGKLGLNYVTTDQQDGLRQATACLIAQGHRRIAYWEHDSRGSARFKGFQQAMKSAGIHGEDSLIDRAFDFDTSCAPALGRLIGQGVTALVTASDYIAMKVLEDARDAGIDIPHQLSVTGFDDNPAAAQTIPPLTTVSVDRYEAGRQMALALVDQHRHPGLNKQYQITIPAQLVLRGSTKSIHSSTTKESSS